MKRTFAGGLKKNSSGPQSVEIFWGEFQNRHEILLRLRRTGSRTGCYPLGLEFTLRGPGRPKTKSINQ
jgi:hypothetical protein